MHQNTTNRVEFVFSFRSFVRQRFFILCSTAQMNQMCESEARSLTI